MRCHSFVPSFSCWINVNRASLHRTGKIPSPDHKAIGPGLKSRGFWIPPTSHLMRGRVKEWAKLADVEPQRIPGYWYNHPKHDIEVGAPGEKGEKVILYFHGGAYSMDTAHPGGVACQVAVGFLPHSTTVRRALGVEYRLSSAAPFDIANPFPAALFDAIAGYNYLINNLGFTPANVFIMGDSAGGHLALTLVRYAVENCDILPVPGGLILCYPWCDMSQSHNSPTGSANTADKTDILTPLYESYMRYATDAFVGPHSPDRNPYLSPGSADPAMESIVTFKGFPKTFICVGDSERLLDQVRVVRGRMVRDLGEEMICYEEMTDTNHGFLSTAFFQAQRLDVYKKIEKWFAQ
jgi:acetyl esterase/lipase